MLDNSSPFAGTEPPGPDAKNLLALRRLRHAILACELAPGAEITEAEIATRYGLGRAGVRAALGALSCENFVVPRPRKGWRVAPVTGALIGDIIGSRRRLEPSLAEHVLAGKEAERLLSLAHISAEISGRDDAQAFMTARVADRQIMEVLACRAGRFMQRWLTEVWDHADRVMHFLAISGFRHLPIDREELITALASGHAALALAELERDIARFQGFVTDSLLRLPLALEAGAGRRERTRRARPGVARPVSPDQSLRRR
jgi:DNA-binding GntR family transcriptional regulator